MSEQAPLVEAPRSRGKLYTLIALAIALVIALVVGIFALANATSGGDSNSSTPDNAITQGKGSPSDPVRIGVVGASDPYWDDYVAAAAAEGISVEIVGFTEYPLPNPALTEGELDLNQFQHIIYLAQYNEDAGEDLTPIGSTAIYPLSLYSTKYASVDEIPAGETVAVPNDPSNLARALLVLQSAGLIELEGGGSIFATPDDIIEEKSRVGVTTLEAALTPTSLPDVAAAIINNDFVQDAGLTFDDAIATDDANDPAAFPYINVFAARAADADNELYRTLVDIFQNTRVVQEGLIEVSGGSIVTVKTPPADLVASLQQVQSDIRSRG